MAKSSAGPKSGPPHPRPSSDSLRESTGRIEKISWQVPATFLGKRLDDTLVELFRFRSLDLSKSMVRKLIMAGAVYQNRRRIQTASVVVVPGATVDVYLDRSKLVASNSALQADRPFTLAEADVLFEDEDLIAIQKPPGLPTQPTLDQSRANLFLCVKQFLTARPSRSPDAEEVYVGLHHRLDRDTSGVVLFTKTKRANPGVAALFAEHKIQKHYWALAHVGAKAIVDAWTVKNFLGKLNQKGQGAKSSRFGAVKSGGDIAITDFRCLERVGNVALLEAAPRTGRTHQIRVHLAEAGNPILGDATYGDRRADEKLEVAVPRLLLHAATLSFVHPITHQSLKIESRLPEDFAQCLQRLKRR